MAEEEKVTEVRKLAHSQWNEVYDRSVLYPAAELPSDNYYTDKMEFPTDPQKLIKVCRFFYKHDPLAGTIINKMVDCAVTSIDNGRGECTDEEYEVYNSIRFLLREFFANVCLEYLLSGLVIPHYEWARKSGTDLSPDLNSRRRVMVPDNFWFRDPAVIILKRGIIPNKRKIYVRVDSETIDFIKTGGKNKDGTYDKETYNELERNYPEFVKLVKTSKGTKDLLIPLPDSRPIFARVLPEDVYPLPYMVNSIESLVHKRNMRKMDFSVASRVIAAIQLIKLGSDLFPTTDDEDFTAIRNQMTQRSTVGYQERLFQLFANHTLQIEWVFPDTAAMLNREKYISIDEDIIAGFGFPRTLITGETSRSNTAGGSDFATASPFATMEAIRVRFLDWITVLYKEIRDRNNFKNIATPTFTPMKLYKMLDLNTIGAALYSEGTLSRDSRLSMLGLEVETEVERKVNDQELYKKNKLEEAPVLPFSSPSIGKTGAKPTTPKAPAKPATTPKTKAEEETPDG
jgi:hypothetical protein